MSLVHMDFPSGQTGLYGTTTSYMLNGLYAETSDISIIEDPDPNVTGNVLSVNGNNANDTDGLRFVLPSSHNKVGLAARIWFPALPTGNGAVPCPFMWRDVSNTNIACITVDSTGRLEARSGTYNGTVVGTTTNPALVANAWQHMEAIVDNTAQTFEIRVEGVTVLSLSGLSLSTNAIAQIFYGTRTSSTGATRSFQLKDTVVYNGAGSINNTFLGSVQVRELLTDSDVSFLWTASSGSTGFNLIDEAPPNDDTDYIYAINPPPGASLFGLTDLPSDVTSVKGLYAVVRSKKTDGGDGTLQVGMKSGSSTGLGTDRPVTTAYTYWTDVFELDPATSAAWTRVGVNAAQLQVNRTL